MGQYHGAQIFYYTYILYQKFWIEIVQTEKEICRDVMHFLQMIHRT